MMKLINKYYQPGSKNFQRLVGHSAQVAELAESIAGRLAKSCDIDRQFVSEAAWLHDIGIFLTNARAIGCYGKEPYLAHGILGAELLNLEGLPQHALVCERHIGVGITTEDIRQQGLPLPLRDMTPQTLEEQIVAYADLFFSKHRTGSRSAEAVRSKLASFDAGKVAIFDRWHARFGKTAE